MERWKIIEEFDRYEVSDLGQVRNRSTGRVLHQYLQRKDGKTSGTWVKLYRDGAEPRIMGVRHLVAAAFLPNPDGLRRLRNIDGDPTNNRADNLEWYGRIRRINGGTLESN